MENYSQYSMSNFQQALNDYYRALTFGKVPVETPTAYILGGQSGAGKSAIHSMVKQENPNFISIDGDTFRKRHLNFEIIQKLYGNDAANYTQPFANNIVISLIEKLSSEHYNLIIEGTCRRADVPLKTCADLKEKGYNAILAVMCTDKNTSWQSTIDRYNLAAALGEPPRAVPYDKYLETVNALPSNIETIYKANAFDDILLLNRNQECLYQYSQSPEINPREIFESILLDKGNELSQEDGSADENNEDMEM
ncbi:MAG: zeta toxin family protein [Oscillospiraceae bacterium]